MIDLNAGLSLFSAAVATGTGLRVTTDPAKVIPPIIFVDLPTVTGRTMAGVTLSVPVYLVAEGSGDQIAGAYLLDHLPDLLNSTATVDASPRPLEIAGQHWPAYYVQSTLTIKDTP